MFRWCSRNTSGKLPSGARRGKTAGPASGFHSMVVAWSNAGAGQYVVRQDPGGGAVVAVGSTVSPFLGKNPP